MSKSLRIFGLLLLLMCTTLAADVDRYELQGTITLVSDITNLGYSPNQKHLIVLADSIPATNFIHYHGLRLNSKQDMTIIDQGATSVKPSAFAFSKDGSWLVVGTSWGAVYGYQVSDGELASNYKYKKHIGDGQPEDGVKSISFSANGQIAVAAKDLLVVLTPPADESATDFDEKARHNCSTILSSVAWKHNSESIVIVGGQRAIPFFHIVDITKQPISPAPIIDPPEQTLSIGVFPDAKETILQGRFNSPIRVFQWDETNKNYINVGTVDNTIKASQISITYDGTYFAAEINTNGQVFAWKSNLQMNSAGNLKNQAPKAINPSILLTTAGKNLALSNDGNRILIIGQNQTANKLSICDKNQWYDDANKVCQPCENGCGSCFNPTDCQSCPDNTTYVDPQNLCKPCSEIKNGCKECQTSTTCDACNTGDNFNPTPDPIDNSCKCASKYFPDNNQCKQCSIINFCLECKSATKCDICIEQNHINKVPIDGKCVCDVGWYLDGTCKDCTEQKGCKDCASATNCTLCDHGNKWTEDPSGKCVCEPGYWQNGNTCELCSTNTPNCTACQQDGVCTKCIDTRVVSDDKTKCVCQGHTYEDTTTQKCELCDDKMKCLHCDPTGNHTCNECDYIDGHRKKQPVDGKCFCQPGYTENQQEVCTQCFVDGCEVCAVLDQCTGCFVEKNFKPNPFDNACVCEDGFLPKKDKQSCSTCGKEIPGCTQCQDLEVCQACSTENHFQPQPNDQNRCSCAATYFLNNTLCELCSLEYKNCEECTETQCTKCQANYLPNDNSTKCFTCVQAIPGCKTCLDLKACTQCNSQKFWQPASDNKTCACKLNYYKNGTQCKWCASQFPYCSNCSIQGCFSCQQTFTYNPQLKTCFCGDEKEIKDGKCEDQSGLSALAIIAIIVGILAVAGAAVAIIKCFKKRQSPLEDGEYEALEGEKNN